MPRPHRSVRGLGDAHAGRREFLTQQSFSFNGQQSSRPSPQQEESISEATSLIRTCEAWAAEAFRLPADFLHSLAQPGKKKRSVAWRGVARYNAGCENVACVLHTSPYIAPLCIV